jgi:hypothetical protein
VTEAQLDAMAEDRQRKPRPSESDESGEPVGYVLSASEILALSQLDQRPLAPSQPCLDCGEPGEPIGHLTCQYPGRVSGMWGS